MARPRLFLVRGLPGSGKTALARGIARHVAEADDFFYREGKYQFSGEHLAEAHRECQKKVERILVGQGENIAVANTFTLRWELDIYYKLFRAHADIIEVTVKTQFSDQELAARCVHGVPVETIARMRARWQE